MGLPRAFESIEFVGDRHEFLVRLARGKVVLHVGCAQHANIPMKNLHLKLVKAAEEVWGIDIDEKGIEHMRKNGISNLILGDAREANFLLSDKQSYFDVVLVPEILEHTGDPIGILTSVSSLVSDKGVIVVTGPNSFGVRRFIWALLGYEAESPDHRFTFHPSGLRLLCEDADLRAVKDFSAIESSHMGGFRHKMANLIFRAIFAWKPYLADSIGLICTKQ